jgi:tryptophanyl-tRNA synthetase
VTVAKDGKVGAFVKTDEDVEGVLAFAEQAARSLGFKKFKNIPKYKALYIEDATEQDVPALEEAVLKAETGRNAMAFYLPSSTYHRFITLFEGDKMSSSRPDTAIFLSDPPAEAAKKILRAKTGGATSVEEQKKDGGKPHQCSVHDMLMAHFQEDDWKLSELFQSCTRGERLCGQCKKEAAAMVEAFLKDFQERKAAVGDSWKDYVVEDP